MQHAHVQESAGRLMKDLPHAACVAESTITFTTQPLKEDERERERGRQRDIEMTSPYFSSSSSEM